MPGPSRDRVVLGGFTGREQPIPANRVLPWCTEDDLLADDEYFDWDVANVNHVREAGVEPEEAEEALLDLHRISRDVYNLAGELRRGAVGATEGGRILFVVFTSRRERARIITARDATRIEKRRYRQRGK